MVVETQSDGFKETVKREIKINIPEPERGKIEDGLNITRLTQKNTEKHRPHGKYGKTQTF
jgi:hypothetical protein